jgi:hypothetical protein
MFNEISTSWVSTRIIRKLEEYSGEQNKRIYNVHNTSNKKFIVYSMEELYKNIILDILHDDTYRLYSKNKCYQLNKKCCLCGKVKLNKIPLEKDSRLNISKYSIHINFYNNKKKCVIKNFKQIEFQIIYPK